MLRTAPGHGRTGNFVDSEVARRFAWRPMEPTYPAMDPNISHPHASTISPAVIEPLRRTKGWARFLSVLGYIGSALMILGGIGMIAGAAMGGMAAGGKSGLYAGVPLGIMGAIYIVMSLLYVVPAVLLGRYATRIGGLMQRQTELDLIATLDAQRAFWKFVGVLTLVVLVAYAVLFVILMITVFAGAMSL